MSLPSYCHVNITPFGIETFNEHVTLAVVTSEEIIRILSSVGGCDMWYGAAVPWNTINSDNYNSVSSDICQTNCAFGLSKCPFSFLMHVRTSCTSNYFV